MRKEISERHVQAIWYDAALRPERLVTRRGSEVRVLDPGEWNPCAGPDFRNAVLEIGPERRRVSGDVEIHVSPGDWELHGHGSDPCYRDVVAHVTWRCGPVPASLPPGAVSIWIGCFMASKTEFSIDQIDLSAYPFAAMPLEGRPCETLVGHNPDEALRTLTAFGRRRLEIKARRIAGRLRETHARRQVFYEEIMTALGYSRNAEAFRRVAARVPIEDMPEDADAAKTALLVAGGFEMMPRSGSRPENSPERRLAVAAAVFRLTDTMSLADASDFSRKSCEAMIATMRGGRDTRAFTAGLGSLMGRGRAAAVIANVIAPFAIAEGHLPELPDWLPPEDVSRPVRLAAFRLFGRDHNPATCYASNGLLIQGLIQLHRDLCLIYHPECDRCDLGSRCYAPLAPHSPESWRF